MTCLYQYQARGPSGKIERGSIEAETREQAVARLAARQLTPYALALAETAARADKLSDEAARDLARSLSQLLNVGLSLSQALKFASESLSSQAASVALRMKEAAERGEAPSAALRQISGPQAKLLAGVVTAGETSGRLGEALEVAARSFERSATLRGRLGSALIYPAFVIAATCATLACFIIVVVPAMASSFAGAEERLPESTRNLLALSAWLSQHGVAMLAALIASGVVVATSAQAQAILTRLADGVLQSPIGLGVTQHLDYAAFASLSALSLKAGVPGANAFAAAAHGTRSASLRRDFEKAVTEIRLGASPASAFQHCGRPPKTFIELMRVGEETGKLGETLEQVATLLSAEGEQRLERLGAIAGPVITILLGGMVASVVMSLFLGLLSMSELATL
ncbi:general secretion pathway protein F [alpha proteobacterium U9-1i]|nr:general secretion pathway protein F [alpha proteobacterium U9-1i]